MPPSRRSPGAPGSRWPRSVAHSSRLAARAKWGLSGIPRRRPRPAPALPPSPSGPGPRDLDGVVGVDGRVRLNLRGHVVDVASLLLVLVALVVARRLSTGLHARLIGSVLVGRQPALRLPRRRGLAARASSALVIQRVMNLHGVVLRHRRRVAASLRPRRRMVALQPDRRGALEGGQQHGHGRRRR